MLKQLAVPQKILGVMIFLFAWSLFTEQVSADERTGTIAFLSDRHRDKNPPLQADISVYVIDADGFNEKPWVLNNLKYGPIAWSPDGKSIAYHLEGQFVTHILLKTPVILPAAWENLRKQRAPKGLLVVPDAPQLEIKNVTKQFGGRKYLSPKWSPDGKWLALTSTDGSPDGMTDVCVMDIEGNQLKNLTQWPGVDEIGSWSPDGSKIVFFSNRDGNGEIYVMDSNGKNQANLTNHPALDAAPTWSPDGRWIAYHAFQVRTPPDIYVMDANGNNWARLTKHPDSDTDPTWVIPARSLSVKASNNQVTLWGRMKLERQ